MNEILKKIRQELIDNSDEKIQKSTLRFFKEEIRCYGIKSATVNKIAKDNFKLIKHNTKTEIFEMCEDLWQSGYIEESFIACHWSYRLHKEYLPEDLNVFKKWINSYISNWATCDTFCNHTMGEFLVKYPHCISELKKWALSENRWMRRASAVSLIIPAKNGMFLKDIFEIADILFLDKDDMVQKGYGWMLKSASHPFQKEIFEYVMKNKSTMPRTALRYAIEKMPTELKAKAMSR
jgi:3-methyladenine DNA glycosylase AlkD